MFDLNWNDNNLHIPDSPAVTLASTKHFSLLFCFVCFRVVWCVLHTSSWRHFFYYFSSLFDTLNSSRRKRAAFAKGKVIQYDAQHSQRKMKFKIKKNKIKNKKWNDTLTRDNEPTQSRRFVRSTGRLWHWNFLATTRWCCLASWEKNNKMWSVCVFRSVCHFQKVFLGESIVSSLQVSCWNFGRNGLTVLRRRGVGGRSRSCALCACRVVVLCVCVCVRWRCSRATAPEFSLVNICRNRRTRHSLVCVYACNKQPANSTQITAGRVELVQLLNVDKNEKGRKESKKAMAMV
jgi:hypothetical protein